MSDPNILRLSFEEIQEFHDLNFQDALDGKYFMVADIISGAVTFYPMRTDEKVNSADVFLKGDFLSAGGGDPNNVGLPVVLNASGIIDASFFDVTSLFYYVGSFTPTASAEYPDTTDHTPGAFWTVTGLGDSDYTFVGGSLAGKVAKDMVTK